MRGVWENRVKESHYDRSLFAEAEHFIDSHTCASVLVGRSPVAFFGDALKSDKTIIIPKRAFRTEDYVLLEETFYQKGRRTLACDMRVSELVRAPDCEYVVLSSRAGYYDLLESTAEMLPALLAPLAALLAGSDDRARATAEEAIENAVVLHDAPAESLGHLLAAMGHLGRGRNLRNGTVRALNHICKSNPLYFDGLYGELMDRALAMYDDFVTLPDETERCLEGVATSFKLGELEVSGMGEAALALARSASTKDPSSARYWLREAAAQGSAERCEGIVNEMLAYHKCSYAYAVRCLTELLPHVADPDSLKTGVIGPISRLVPVPETFEIYVDTAGNTAPMTRDVEPDDLDNPQYRFRLSEAAFDSALDSLFAQREGYNPRNPEHARYRKWANAQARCSMEDDEEVVITEELAEVLLLNRFDLQKRVKKHDV